jgi:hypothetical protein
MILKLIRSAGLALAASVLVTACGGGGSDGGTAAQGNSSTAAAATVVAGTLTGFGSVVIDGVHYPEGNVNAARDVDGIVERAITMAGVKIGQQVEASLDDQGRVTKVLVRATAEGPVEAVDVTAATLTVAGQTIHVTTGDGATLFEGAAGLEDLSAGDWVEVHGTLNADGEIVATRIEVKPAGGETQVRAAGLIQDLDETAKTFMLGGLTVDYASAAIRPDGATLANDVFVFVYADAAPSGGTLTAKSVRVARKPKLEGREFRIGGLVTDAAADGRTFKVNGVRVDATTAELKGGGLPVWTDVKDMALVRVEGTLGTDSTGVVLKATRVILVPASEQRAIVLIGQVSDFVSAASFTVRGTPVNAATATFSNGTIDDLADGAFVEVKGRIEGDMIKADTVRFRQPVQGMTVKFFGTVSEFDAAAGTFKLAGLSMTLSDGVVFKNGTAADFVDGARVQVKGSFDGTRFVVTEVEFKSALSAVLVHLEGVASEVGATSLVVNGATIQIAATTRIEGGPLADGQRVEVVAQWVGGDLVATKIEVDEAGVEVRLSGPITDFVSRADFKVADQRVDASAAELKNGDAAALANGALVRVRGTLDAGVVIATRVEFLR